MSVKELQATLDARLKQFDAKMAKMDKNNAAPEAPAEGVATRGDGLSLIEDVEIQNLILIVGAQPGLGVSADTKLIKDVMRNFQQQYDKKTLTLEFPKILNQLKGSDSKLEII